MKIANLIISSAVVFSMTACGFIEQPIVVQFTKSSLDPEAFIGEYNEKETKLITLKNESGMEVCITNFGGRIVSIMVPDKEGIDQDVVLGFDNIESYFPENNASDFGATIGRYANRINKGRFALEEGDTIQLPQNNLGHCLHGGPTGWQYQVYEVVEQASNRVKLLIDSPDKDNNFPGHVKAYVTYTLTDENQIDIQYEATTDKPTIINMTNHSYFNLHGDAEKSIEDVLLTINADYFTPTDTTYMTTGEILPVKGTPMDFRKGKAIGKDINSKYAQIVGAHGYDHNWVLNTAGDISIPCAIAVSPQTGITLTVYTDEPGIQLYTGNFLDGSNIGKEGTAYQKRVAFCLETQHYPDSPNKPEWPSVVLLPDSTYHSHTIYEFGVKK